MENLNYALFGLGTIAKNHLLSIKSIPVIYNDCNFKVNLNSLYTTHKEDKETLGKLIGFQKVVDKIDDIENDSSIDVIDICTPNYLHFEQVLDSVQHEKNVYCEKPLTANVYDAAALLSKLENVKAKTQVALVLRFLPAVAQAHAIIKSGVIGKVKSFHFEMLHTGYLNPSRRISWRLEKAKSGGGAIVDLGIHLIDLSRFLIGDVERVSAFVGTTVASRKLENSEKLQKVDVDDWGYVMVTASNDVKGFIEVLRVAVGNEGTRLFVYCTEGSIKIDLASPYNAVIFDLNGKQLYIDDKVFLGDDYFCEVKKLYPDPKVSMGSMVDLHYTGLLWFFKSILQNTVPAGTPTFQEAYKDQLVVEAIYKSAANNGELTEV
ncbi:MAG: Gfo/Idh/MocA family protein [Caldisericum sp.]